MLYKDTPEYKVPRFRTLEKWVYFVMTCVVVIVDLNKSTVECRLLQLENVYKWKKKSWLNRIV